MKRTLAASLIVLVSTPSLAQIGAYQSARMKQKMCDAMGNAAYATILKYPDDLIEKARKDAEGDPQQMLLHECLRAPIMKRARDNYLNHSLRLEDARMDGWAQCMDMYDSCTEKLLKTMEESKK